MSKRALGKGIDALLQGRDLEQLEKMSALITVSIDKVRPNPQQPRQVFNRSSLEELSKSIREKGIIQPIIAEDEGNGRYTVIAGERRFRAAQIAGLKEIPVLPRNFSEEEKFEIALIENIHREDLSPIEEAKAYAKIIETYGLSQEELSKKIGKNRSTIANSVRLLNLPEEMQNSLDRKEMTAGHARALLSIEDAERQREVFSRVLKEDLSVRETEKLASERSARAAAKKKVKPSAPERNVDLYNMENRFIELLGTKVSIKGDGQKGKVEIFYYSLEDLNRIFEILEK